MARVHKVEMYLVDPNDYYNDAESEIECLIDRSEFYSKFLRIKSSKYFEWDDDIILNKYACTKEDCESFLE